MSASCGLYCMTKRLFLATPTGFCGGVRHAVAMFHELAAKHPGERIYVLHELVHNRLVTEEMRNAGAIFVEDVEEIPEGSLTLLGAHGCGESVERRCRERHLCVFDATCPLVTQLQKRAAASDPAVPIVFLGDRDHPEVRGITDRLGGHVIYLVGTEEEAQALPLLSSAIFFSQTTRCITEIQRIRDILKERVAKLEDHAHVCDAVQMRQNAMASLAGECQVVYVIGSPHSSNARRLAEIAQENGCADTRFAENAEAIHPGELSGVERVGLGTATSTPDDVIEAVLAKFAEMGFQQAK